MCVGASCMPIREFAEEDWRARIFFFMSDTKLLGSKLCVCGEKWELTRHLVIVFNLYHHSSVMAAHAAANQNPCNCCACLFRLLIRGTTLSMLIGFGAN